MSAAIHDLYMNSQKDVLNMVATEAAETVPESRSSSRLWPDIGKDPLKSGDMDADTALDRLRKGTGLQQKEVPDQTMLAWRIDVDRICGELIWRRAAMKSIKDQDTQIRKLIDALKQIAHPRKSYHKCHAIARAALGIPANTPPAAGG